MEPCRERCFGALPVANALSDDRELIAQVERIASIPETIKAEKGVGRNVCSTLVALNECLGLRDADREECGEGNRIILATERTRHAGSMDGGFQRCFVPQRHRRGTGARHDFRMERDDFDDTQMADLGHLLLRKHAIARLVLLPTLFEDRSQLRR